MSKNQYSQLCQSESLPIFMQDWWLDSVCGTDNWQPILIFDKNEKIIGASFYYNKNRYSLKTVMQPIITPFSGVWFRPSNFESSRKKQQYEADILKKIAKKLPNVTIFAQNFHFSLTNILPFHWAGFKNTMRYTYVFENIKDKNEIYKGFNESVRQVIKKGENLIFEPSDDVKTLYNLYKNSLNHANTNISFDFDTLNLLYQKIKENDAGQIFQVKDDENQVVSSSLVVWDKTTAYLLILGNSRLHQSGATCLIWQLFPYLIEKNIQNFDLEGSMLPTVEKFYRSLGAERKPYFRISKIKNKFLELLLILANKI